MVTERRRARLRSVDAFRGLVLALMVFTPATGGPDHFGVLRHAAWNGATLSDLVFPTFLVTSGVSLSFLLRPPTSRRVRVRLLRRTVVLVVLGLVYNAYGASGWDLSALRFTGVLQTIGVAGAVAALAVLALRRRGSDHPVLLVVVAAAVTTAYWAGMAMLGRCAPAGSCSPWFDLDAAVVGEAHTYAGGTRGFDPEGIAATVAASALVLAGYVAGVVLRRARMSVGWFAPALLVGGALLAGTGLLLEETIAHNKRLLSPSFVLLASGAALVAFAVVAVVLDLPSSRRAIERARDALAWPFVALGRNALVVFLLERFLLQTAGMVSVGDRTTQAWLLDALPVGRPGVHLAYTAVLLVVIVAVVGVLHRRRRYLAL